jgi:hypothetical protein
MKVQEVDLIKFPEEEWEYDPSQTVIDNILAARAGERLALEAANLSSRLVAEAREAAITALLNAGGTQGPQGPTGLPGPKGDTGERGLQGEAGATGPQGLAGTPGPKGDTGTTGSPGTKGDTGAQGIQGIQGTAGTPGASGATGPQGDIGPTGLQGPAGSPGPKGDTGNSGLQGDPGTPGTPGAKGDQGIQGIQGPQGDPGPAVSFPIPGAITSSGGGIGYVAGAGGTVTQLSSRTTGVTLSKLCGNITMFSTAQAAQALVTFTLTNTFIAASDTLVVTHISATNGGSWCFSTVCGAGSATISVKNVSNASITSATPLRFSLIKGAIS